ncbi:MAG: thiamine pyrophosphate-dependent dehydrogenase E1 component subunit alpha, partial [Hyphomicrobiales bacterium]|nr:thiamine pyrophosphate-dependent dehydrogenase E1 component subunit alpha [Hyphomicrobiales bacterium]
RPGDRPDFSYLRLPPAGAAPRPPVDAPAIATRDLAFGLVRTLDDDGVAVGEWNPGLGADELVRGLRTMALVRAFDERMFRAQRQGKTPFYMKCTGEEAVATAQTYALRPDDMCFATYRQQAILVARGTPLDEMMGQIYANALDPTKGRQLPVMYTAKSRGYFSQSGNLATQFPQAVGWAMASAYRRDTRIASGWIGDGASAEGDFHQALVFASVHRAPVVLNLVNNQWAISSAQSVAGGEESTFASRAIGYGIPGVRVDGNDYLAVFAASRWAAERARSNHGPTLIEHFTYRAAPHSTSDDPARYRAGDEWERWPLGDPIARLKLHLVRAGAWDDGRHSAMLRAVEADVAEADARAQALGVHGDGPHHDPLTMFDDVYKDMPWNLREQRDELAALPGRAT